MTLTQTTEHGRPAGNRPSFTITEAASACSVSRKTITRKLPELSTHGAAKDDDGVWRIPVEALLAVGLHPGRSVGEGGPTQSRQVASAEQPRPNSGTGPDTVTVSRDRWDDLRIRLARAEAEAAERALALADARLALRALTAGPSPREVEPPSEAVAQPHIPAGPAATTGAATGPEVAVELAAQVPPTPPPGQPAARSDSSPIGSGPEPPGTNPGQRRYPSQPATHPQPGPASSPEGTAERASGAAGAGPASPDELMPQGIAGDVVAARRHAARTGGYVPASATPPKKRRWWRSA